MTLIDTHAHIYYDKYEEDLEEVLERASEAKVEKIICVAVDLKSAEKCLNLVNKYPNLYMTAGIHPHDSKDTPSDFLKQLEPYYSHPKTVAVGEIGLDLHYNFSNPTVQLSVFSAQLELAKSVGLPAVVHCRDAEKEILHEIQTAHSEFGVIHCFSGGLSFAKDILKTGYKISFTGLITFTGSDFKEVIENVDLEEIMVETDCPYLAPTPFRGKRNEPMHVSLIAKQIAEWKNTTTEIVAEKTTQTAYAVFPKLRN